MSQYGLWSQLAVGWADSPDLLCLQAEIGFHPALASHAVLIAYAPRVGGVFKMAQGAIDALCRLPGAAAAMIKVGLLRETEEGLELHGWKETSGAAIERSKQLKAASAERAQRSRDRKAGQGSGMRARTVRAPCGDLRSSNLGSKLGGGAAAAIRADHAEPPAEAKRKPARPPSENLFERSYEPQLEQVWQAFRARAIRCEGMGDAMPARARRAITSALARGDTAEDLTSAAIAAALDPHWRGQKPAHAYGDRGAPQPLQGLVTAMREDQLPRYVDEGRAAEAAEKRRSQMLSDSRSAAPPPETPETEQEAARGLEALRQVAASL